MSRRRNHRHVDSAPARRKYWFSGEGIRAHPWSATAFVFLLALFVWRFASGAKWLDYACLSAFGFVWIAVAFDGYRLGHSAHDNWFGDVQREEQPLKFSFQIATQAAIGCMVATVGAAMFVYNSFFR